MNSDLKAILDWASQNPWLAFWLILAVAVTVEIIAKCVVLIFQAIFQKDMSGLYAVENLDDKTVRLTKVDK